MDTIWMRLNTAEGTEYFMFGDGGVVNFKPLNETKSVLLFSHGGTAVVEESNEQIFELIRQFRGTTPKV